MYYPWQRSQWQQLMAAKNAGRLPHALLLTGIAGTGKTLFADSLIRTFLCESNKDMYCNTCHACRLTRGKVHPNIFGLEPEKVGQAIKVDQIRAVSEFVAQSSLKGTLRFVVINPADDMNLNAANALLKTLEEPANDAILILIASEASRMPATILSRCQRIVFSRPEKSLALSWLAENGKITNPELLLHLANGAPLAALALSQDDTLLSLRESLYQTFLNIQKTNPIKAAANLDYDLLLFLDHSLTWLKDLVQLQLNIDAAELTNCDYASQLMSLKNATRIEQTSTLLTYIQMLRGQIRRGFNLNKQLIMESIFIRWLACLTLLEPTCS